MKNKCYKHNIKWDFDEECPRCQRDKYENEFRAEVYKNAEERFRQEIISRNETIESQNKELNNLKAIKEELLTALKTVVNRCDELTTMNYCRSNGISDFIIEHAKGTIERAEQ